MRAIKIFILIFQLLFTSFVCNEERSLSSLKVDFHESMLALEGYCKSFPCEDARWNLVWELYNNNVLHELHVNDTERIPFVIHHIWLGSPIPKYVKKLRKTWMNHHQDWTYVLWTDYPSEEYGIVLRSFKKLRKYLNKSNKSKFIVMDMNKVRLHNQVAYDQRARNYGEKSDIVRYEVLYNVGGLYVDTDFECIQNFDDFHYCYEFYTGISYTLEMVLYNGLIGASRKHPVLQTVIDKLHDRPVKGNSLKYTGPYFFTKCFVESVSESNRFVVAFPVTFFYPWPPTYRNDKESEPYSWLLPESYALHYWKVSWSK